MSPVNRRVRKAPPPPDVLATPPEPSVPSKRTVTFLRVRRILGQVAGVVFVVTTAILVAVATTRYVRASPRFALSEVVVSGNKLRSREALLGRASLHLGDNVFTIDLDLAHGRLIEDPFIAEATLARRLPHTIVVTVRERVPAAVVSLGGDAYLATREGEIVKRLEPTDPHDLPVVTGLPTSLLEQDRGEVVRLIVRALDVGGDYERSSLANKERLEEIHLDAEGGITLVVGPSGMTLVLGGPPFKRKLEEASRAILDVQHRGSQARAVFLDNDARPERVVVRVK